jgi:hypothetical protein
MIWRCVAPVHHTTRSTPYSSEQMCTEFPSWSDNGYEQLPAAFESDGSMAEWGFVNRMITIIRQAETLATRGLMTLPSLKLGIEGPAGCRVWGAAEVKDLMTQPAPGTDSIGQRAPRPRRRRRRRRRPTAVVSGLPGRLARALLGRRFAHAVRRIGGDRRHGGVGHLTVTTTPPHDGNCAVDGVDSQVKFPSAAAPASTEWTNVHYICVWSHTSRRARTSHTPYSICHLLIWVLIYSAYLTMFITVAKKLYPH